jgi:hypothetical protein
MRKLPVFFVGLILAPQLMRFAVAWISHKRSLHFEKELWGPRLAKS